MEPSPLSAISPILRSVAGGGLMFWCPGCDGAHMVMVGEGAGPRWGFNGNHDRPTFTPSILVSGTEHITADEHTRIMAGETIEKAKTVCHSFVADGRIQFLGDCTHALAGKTVDLPDFES
jgi:hypothetical protein